MHNQTILYVTDNYLELDNFFQNILCKKIFLVCGKSFRKLKLFDYFNNLKKNLGIKVELFSDFQPNPLYESVENGVKNFIESKSDVIVAVGGGSAIDVAKCIKLYCNMNMSQNFLTQKIIPNDIPFLAVPTTAGTGSEATKFAVIYFNGEKQSITDESCIPQAVLFDVSVLKTLPLYQKKSTMLDAFCHALESFWSVNSTDESKLFSKNAIKMILENKNSYLENEEIGNKNMLFASNLAGKAINITQTTAGHAMCYKLTSLYNISHGHAAALCVKSLFPFMKENLKNCSDIRGQDYLKSVFDEIAIYLDCKTVDEACEKVSNFIDELDLPPIKNVLQCDIKILCNSVNPVRLKNHPIKLSSQNIEDLYKKILGVKK